MLMNYQLSRYIFQKQYRIPLLTSLSSMSNQLQPDSSSNQDHESSSTNTFDIPFTFKFKQYKPKGLMKKVSYMLIRPPRFVYNQKLLLLGKKTQQKYSYEVHKIPFPVSIYWADQPKYIILYLHGNSSSRLQGYLHLLKLPQGACLACFDFNGCGLRKQSDFITLGKQQSKQVDVVAKYLKQFGLPVVGWGRSMGAVSLLMSSQCDVMITDSPFSSLYDLCKETSTNASPKICCCFIHCFFPCVFWCVRNSVQQLSGMDPNQLQVIHTVQKLDSKKKLLILAGKDDKMIHFSHSQRLIQAFRGQQKKLILFDGTHNSNRPQQVLNQCYNFINKSIQDFVPPSNSVFQSKEVNIIKISQCPKSIKKKNSVYKQNQQLIQMKRLLNNKKLSEQQLMRGNTSQEDLSVKRQSVDRTSFKQISKLNMLMNMNRKQKFLPPLGESELTNSKLLSYQIKDDETRNNSFQTSGIPFKNSILQEESAIELDATNLCQLQELKTQKNQKIFQIVLITIRLIAKKNQLKLKHNQMQQRLRINKKLLMIIKIKQKYKVIIKILFCFQKKNQYKKIIKLAMKI